MSWGQLQEVFTGAKVVSKMGILSLEMPPHSVQIFVPAIQSTNGYSAYERIP